MTKKEFILDHWIRFGSLDAEVVIKRAEAVGLDITRRYLEAIRKAESKRRIANMSPESRAEYAQLLAKIETAGGAS